MKDLLDIRMLTDDAKGHEIDEEKQSNGSEDGNVEEIIYERSIRRGLTIRRWVKSHRGVLHALNVDDSR